MKFKFLSHTADLKFRAYGKNLSEVFSNSAYALLSQIYEEKPGKEKSFSVKVSGKDFENLLYNFLEEILFLIDSKNFFPSEIKEIKIDKEKFRLSANFVGGSGENSKVFSHIKAITYNEMFVKKEKGRWVAQVVIDV